MAILNLGSGLPVFVGPAIMGLFIGSVGNAGIIWLLAILYFTGAFLTRFITLPNNAKTAHLVDNLAESKVTEPLPS